MQQNGFTGKLTKAGKWFIQLPERVAKASCAKYSSMDFRIHCRVVEAISFILLAESTNLNSAGWIRRKTNFSREMVRTSGSAHCWCELHNSIAVWIYGTVAEQ